MMTNLKTVLAAGMTALTVIAGSVPSFAALNITDYSTTNVTGCGIETMIIDKNRSINANGSNVNILNASEINVVNSCIDTLIDAGITSIDVQGENIDITTLDATNIKDSVVITILKQKANLVNAQERLKAVRW